MNDTIYRRDAIQALVDTKEIKGFAYRMLEDRLIGLPSAHSLQGEWIEQEECWQCSECGDEYVLEVGVKPIDAKMHYCPNCGSKMRGEHND